MSILIFLPLLATILAVLSRSDQQIFMSLIGAGLGLGIAVYTFHQCADPAQPQSKGE